MKKNAFERTLSVIVAFAVIAVTLFAAVPAVNLSVSAATVEDTWDGTRVKPTKTDADGNILIETAEELAWAALEGSTVETKDKNYKVVDNAVFNLNGLTGVTLDSTASEVSDATATGNNWVSSAKTFAGSFDGNGVVIYNMYSSGAYNGLFPWINVDNSNKTCNFSNITIKASYIKGYHYAAPLVGLADAPGTGVSVNVTNCKVENCYVNATDNNTACNRTGTLLVGGAGHNKVVVDSCVAINNVIVATDIKGGFVGDTSAYAADSIFKNSVVIGSTPYPTVQAGSKKVIRDKITKASCYSNVYTDQDVSSTYAGYVTKVATADMKGSAAKVNMPSLDWSKLIAFDGEYPDLRTNHALTTVSNGDSGHSTSCSDCGKALTETHNMVENFDTMVSSCACGYETPITQMKDSWDGTQATSFAGGTGTKDDPYIIKTAEQMAYVALSTTLDSKGKYFKVTDNAVFNMNGAIGITLNSSAAEVKAAPKNGAYIWTSDSAKFNGNFDGNGVIIYNVYGPKMGYGGLFPHINTDNNEKSVTIKNVAVKASFFAGYHAAGGIVGDATAITTSQNLIFENCMVENCYMTDMSDTNPACSRTVGTIVGRVAHNKVTVDNCIAKGNLLEAINIVGGFVGNTSHYAANAVIKNSISIGTLPYSTASANTSSALEEMVTKADCYSNVYTDKEVSAAYNAKQVKSLTVAEMSGVSSLDNVALNYEKVWFANEGTPELQLFHNLKGNADETNAYSGHKADCEDCGLKGISVSAHDYDSNYICTVCEFICDHENSDYKTVTEDELGNCVTAPNTKTECNCGYVHIDYHGTVDGHKLVKVEAVEATCIDNGNIEHWTCETCGGIFLTADKMAAMDTAVTEKEILIEATQQHIPIEDSKGNVIFGMDGQKHWMICKFCNCELEKTSHDVEYDTENTGGHSGKCVVCLYEVHDYANINENGKPVHSYDDTAHWLDCKVCGKTEYAEHTLETDENVEGIYQWCEDAEGNSCGYEIFKYALQSDDGLVSIAGSANVFSKDVITDLFRVSADETLNYDEIKAIFDKEGHKNFTAYDFSPSEEIAEGGSIDLKMVVGDIYGKNAAIYYVDTENGALKKLDTIIEEIKDEKGNITYVANANITKIGLYAVASSEVVGSGAVDDTNNNNNAGINGDTSPISPPTGTQNVASAAVVAVLSAAAIVFARKIKKS
ncbi:MAG: hypothetical protein IJN56_04720 [Clostridia bacterium]|nr:hypothetical protein [Clostridia bacterium]